MNLSDTCIDPPNSSTSTEDRELWEAALKYFVAAKKNQLTTSEQKIVASAGLAHPNCKDVKKKAELSSPNAREFLSQQRGSTAESVWDYPALTLVRYNNEFLSILNQNVGFGTRFHEILSNTSLVQFQEYSPLLSKDYFSSMVVEQTWNTPSGGVPVHSEMRLVRDGDKTTLQISATKRYPKLASPEEVKHSPPSTNTSAAHPLPSLQVSKLPQLAPNPVPNLPNFGFSLHKQQSGYNVTLPQLNIPREKEKPTQSKMLPSISSKQL
eukprot:CAMPEP_0206200070 /NCGR_PEP_ID=MMETSP0166-20121206/10661_1 /ASSEMBLY_ACC=CAM_ASM_000260 /TAXON_ID=95228 /ORGANISM="Vannella robusta, Strain DIVA3 518/3/11/1/6" /LENGTH=266 /DNA_ID=CAMNT_0053618339 /DNA_START=90 /DNA_END=890 /DNA_ORIENTATION=-